MTKAEHWAPQGREDPQPGWILIRRGSSYLRLFFGDHVYLEGVYNHLFPSLLQIFRLLDLCSQLFTGSHSLFPFSQILLFPLPPTFSLGNDILKYEPLCIILAYVGVWIIFHEGNGNILLMSLTRLGVHFT